MSNTDLKLLKEAILKFDDVISYKQLACKLKLPIASVMSLSCDDLDEALEMNKIRMKMEMTANWRIAENAKLQENAFALMADNDELARLGRDPVESNGKGKDPLLGFLKKIVSK